MHMVESLNSVRVHAGKGKPPHPAFSPSPLSRSPHSDQPLSPERAGVRMNHMSLCLFSFVFFKCKNTVYTVLNLPLEYIYVSWSVPYQNVHILDLVNRIFKIHQSTEMILVWNKIHFCPVLIFLFSFIWLVFFFFNSFKFWHFGGLWGKIPFSSSSSRIFKCLLTRFQVKWVWVCDRIQVRKNLEEKNNTAACGSKGKLYQTVSLKDGSKGCRL